MAKKPAAAGSPRFEDPDPSKMGAEQRRVYDMVLGKRGKLPGPFRIWLANPEFSEIAETFGRRVRFGSGLSRRVVELATIIACRSAVCLAFAPERGARGRHRRGRHRGDPRRQEAGHQG